jgi:CubicO group peptidase (beta-lactamase class C family)
MQLMWRLDLDRKNGWSCKGALETMAEMHRLSIVCMTLCLACIGCSSTNGALSNVEEVHAVISDTGVGDIEIVRILSNIRKESGVPAMAAALLTSKGLRKVGAVGTRKWGADIPVSLDDLWHLGSDTKIMTSTLAALLVEQGKIKWTTTVSEVFPDIADSFNPEVKGITILQLLSHMAGIPDNVGFDTFSTSIPVREQRIEALKIALSAKLQSSPGTEFFYSNLGYVIAGAMIERVLDMDWEMAVTKYIFKPLQMSSAGFGGLGTVGMIDQPWGHESSKKPFDKNGPDADNPPVMGPAGRVHSTIQDWALFITDQLRGAQGKQGILSNEDYQMLQSSHFGGEYGLGWQVVQREWAGGKALTHMGSNTIFLSLVWIAPAKDFAILVCTNEGLDSFGAADEAITKLIPLAASL